MSYSVGGASDYYPGGAGGPRGGGAGSPHSRTSTIGADQRSVLSMDEAYLRLGHKLSQKVAGGQHYQSLVVVNLGSHPKSAFGTGQQQQQQQQKQQLDSQGRISDQDRTSKVAKMRYSDHGSHQLRPKGDSIVKKVTCGAKTTFRKVSETAKDIKQMKRRQQQRDEVERTKTSIKQQQSHLVPLNDVKDNAANPNKDKGLLHSVLESPKQRKCLTTPKEPISNQGLDNAEGNLICYEGDIIRPTSVQTLLVHTSSPATSGNDQRCKEKLVTLQILRLLGQGTFAQVFLCESLETGERMALKVVKNKQAYTRQAAIEIDVFRALATRTSSSSDGTSNSAAKQHMVQLEAYFCHQNHLCLVFELLGLNLYEVLKRRQFRGLPLLTVRSILRQAMDAVKDLSGKSIVHCDLKPENILIDGDDDHSVLRLQSSGKKKGSATNNTTMPTSKSDSEKHSGSSCGNITVTTKDSSGSSGSSGSETSKNSPRIKLIDFGSACFEGHTAHTYIQSRFYRSPEVLIGLPYDSAIDMWSLGCVAAELFLGLPILPGVHEHDQIGRLCEMIGPLPDWMLDQGTKSTKFFMKQFTRSSDPNLASEIENDSGMPPPKPSWRIKTQQEYIQSLSASEIRKKGGLAKLEKQPTNRYFKRKKLTDILLVHGQSEDKEQLASFVHFLQGILDPDPWKRWTALQASQHPFITGSNPQRRCMDSAEQGEKTSHEYAIHWVPPWDASFCRRKLLSVQKTREKQQGMRRNFGTRHYNETDKVQMESPDKFRRSHEVTVSGIGASSGSTNTSRVTAMTDAMSLSRHSHSHSQTTGSGSDRTSPPSSLGPGGAAYQPSLTGSIGSVLATGTLAEASGGIDHPVGIVNTGFMQQGASYADGYNRHPPISGEGGPQSFSGLSCDGSTMLVDADFGYALQRPGVVPSTSDMAGSYSSLSSASGLTAFSPHNLVRGGVAPTARSVPGLSQVGLSGGRNVTVPLGNRRGTSRRNNYGSSASGSMGQHHHYMNHPSSIREDGSDSMFNSNDGSTIASSVASGASILAQQLEEQAAQRASDNSMQRQQHYGGHHPAYGQSAPSHPGYYNAYITTDGVPMVAPAGTSLDMAPPSHVGRNDMHHQAMPPGGVHYVSGSGGGMDSLNRPHHHATGGQPPLHTVMHQQQHYYTLQQKQQQRQNLAPQMAYAAPPYHISGPPMPVMDEARVSQRGGVGNARFSNQQYRGISM